MKLTLGMILPFALTLVFTGAIRLGLGAERGARLAGGAVIGGFLIAWAIVWRPGWMPAEPFARIGHIALGALLMGLLGDAVIRRKAATIVAAIGVVAVSAIASVTGTLMPRWPLPSDDLLMIGLLAVLALANPKPVLRLQLTSLLWSQRDTVQARGSLRQALHDLHDSLGPLGTRFLTAERHHLTLKGDGLWIDLQDLAQPDQTSPERLAQFSSPLVEDLVGLDPAFDHWLEETRGRIVRQGISIGERMLLAQQDNTSVQDTAKHLLALDETHEGAWRAVIRAQIAQGDASAALGSYKRETPNRPRRRRNSLPGRAHR